MKLLSTVTSALFVSSLSLCALADIKQPNNETIPNPPGCSGGKPTGLGSVFACQCEQPNVCNIGASCPGGSSSCDPGTNGTCETTMWHNVNDDACIPSNLSGLDPVADAMITPETFRPTCPLTFKVVSRGTALFKDVFGWYNVTGSKPDSSDLHDMISCNAVVGDNVLLDIQNNPAYKGGEIGFFLGTPEGSESGKCAGGDCCASVARITAGEGKVFYSQRQFNPDYNGANSYIHLLIYDSRITPHKFYFAWEDIPGGSSDDFTDLVTSVMGVECAGGGLTCEVSGQKGICKQGVTQCKGGTVECLQVLQGEAEKCDGVDNDCNDLVDDNATCPANKICHKGRCVGNCTGVEFPCVEANTVCDHATGLCVPSDCLSKTCPEGKVCRNGQCTSPCEGVVCPHGQSCFNDSCIDLCEGVQCAAPKTCRLGICFEGCGQCNGAACEQGLKCITATGQCSDPSCSTPCAAGTHCENGACKDDCDGAKCPGGLPCVQGKCTPVTTDAGLSDAPPTDAPFFPDGGFAGSGGSFPSPDGSVTDAQSDGPTGTQMSDSLSKDPECACHTVPSHSTWSSPLSLLGLLLLTLRRKRSTIA